MTSRFFTTAKTRANGSSETFFAYVDRRYDLKLILGGVLTGSRQVAKPGVSLALFLEHQSDEYRHVVIIILFFTCAALESGLVFFSPPAPLFHLRAPPEFRGGNSRRSPFIFLLAANDTRGRRHIFLWSAVSAFTKMFPDAVLFEHVCIVLHV